MNEEPFKAMSEQVRHLTKQIGDEIRALTVEKYLVKASAIEYKDTVQFNNDIVRLREELVAELTEQNKHERQVMERLPNHERLTDEDLVWQAIERANERDRPIEDADARVIASQLHNGQASALYSLASTGTINKERLDFELALSANASQYNARDLMAIDKLYHYTESRRDDTEPREGWHKLWIEPEPQVEGRTLTMWHRFLTTRDGEPTGHLETPGSRYGSTSNECAWWAVAALNAFDEYVDELEADLVAEDLMGLAVNNHESIAELVGESEHLLPQWLKDELDIDR